jgi:starch-binding outer membrane protein, SusD/RagB family
VFENNMKKKIIAIGFSALILVSSCDVLDIEPVTQVDAGQSIVDINSAQGAVNGMYNNLQGVYDWRVQVISDVASDVSQQIDTWDALINVDEFSTTPDNSEISDLYTVLYRCSDIANNIIAKVPHIEGAEATKNDFMGQAYFVRALAYFDLARFWGGIPGAYEDDGGVVVKLTPSLVISESDYAPRATLAATYQQVEADLLEALNLLPETRMNGQQMDNLQTRARATKATARALLARYYLYTRNWAQAESYATAVINDNRFRLVPFESIFRNRNTEESVFELQFNNNDVSGLRNWYYPTSLSGRGGVALHNETYQEMIADPNDVRGQLTARNATTNVYYTTKWNTPGNADNIAVIRIAEMYLIRAEARAQVGTDLTGAQTDLNAIRNRAGLGNTAAATQPELLDAILAERKLEFIGEGHRWFDLIRAGKAMTVLSNVKRTRGSQPSYSIGTPGRQVFPFPNIEVLTNTKLQQNSAYR